MNPVAINSVNIINFGFKATFDILNRQIKFTIAGLTTFNTGGASNVKGINFEVTDPSGVVISPIDFPTKDITPAVSSVFNLPIASGDSIYGVWKIKAVIKEADDVLYTITSPDKELCKPYGIVDDIMPGVLGIKVDCASPYIQVSEKTVFSYKNSQPLTKVKTGTLYFPRGTQNDLAFTTTPFQSNKLFTGDYEVRLRTIATFDLDDNIFVEIAYDSREKRNVTCKDRLCDIACCIEEVYSEYTNNCKNAKGKAAKEKLDKITIPLLTAQAKERCGKDASEEIKIIADILNCDCNCAGQQVEAAPAQLGDGNAVVVEGACATDVTSAVNGTTTTYTAKTKNVIIGKKDNSDNAFGISKTETDCDITYLIGWDYAIVADSILTSISNNQALQDFLNTLIYTTGVGVILNGLDGKCVIDLTTCNYSLFLTSPNTTKIVSIIINSTAYVAPANLLVTNTGGVLAWLNGLGKGTFTVISVGGIGVVSLTFGSVNNTNTVNTLNYQLAAIDPVSSVNFTASCKTLKDILQAIIDYLCELETSQVVLGEIFEGCKLSDDGTESEDVTYPADTTLNEFLQSREDAFCALISKVLELDSVTCEKVKAIHPFRNDVAMTSGDGLYIVKSGECAMVSPRELALYIFGLAKTDAAVKEAFCTIDCTLPAAGCPNVTDFVEVPGDTAGVPNITIPSVTFSVAPLVNQYLTIKYRQFGTTPWTVSTTTAEAYPNGSLVSPEVIEGLTNGTSYEVNIQVTPSGSCSPLGTSKFVTTNNLAVNPSVTFVNNFDLDAYTITSIKFGAGSNILGGPLERGENFIYDYSGLGAGPFVLKMTFGGITSPSKLHIDQLRGMTSIYAAYFTYTTGEATVYGVFNPATGDIVSLRNALEHLKSANYDVNEGSVAPACSLPLFTVNRNAIATADAIANGDSADVEIGWDASNSGAATDTVTFAPSDNSKTGSHGNIGAGSCFYVHGTINSVGVTPP